MIQNKTETTAGHNKMGSEEKLNNKVCRLQENRCQQLLRPEGEKKERKGFLDPVKFERVDAKRSKAE